MKREIVRSALAGLLVVVALAQPALAAGDGPERSLLMLEFELIDEQQGSVPFPEKEALLRMAAERLRARFESERLYKVLDPAPVADDISAILARSSFLTCNGCEQDVARKLGAQRVLLAWVQKVSNLILNLNIEIRDVESGRTVLNKSVDLRGNTERSWQRGIDFMVRDMVERGQRNL